MQLRVSERTPAQVASETEVNGDWEVVTVAPPTGLDSTTIANTAQVVASHQKVVNLVAFFAPFSRMLTGIIVRLLKESGRRTQLITGTELAELEAGLIHMRVAILASDAVVEDLAVKGKANVIRAHANAGVGVGANNENFVGLAEINALVELLIVLL